MYDGEEELRQLKYSLHAVMVHEGSIDSGHYWAYVRDHKRNVRHSFSLKRLGAIQLMGFKKPVVSSKRVFEYEH